MLSIVGSTLFFLFQLIYIKLGFVIINQYIASIIINHYKNMAKIALEKYVSTCVFNLQETISEDLVIEYTNNLYNNHKGEYKDLTTRVIYDICRVAYQVFRVLSDEDYEERNDKKIKSLHFKAFQLAFPKAWANIASKG